MERVLALPFYPDSAVLEQEQTVPSAELGNEKEFCRILPAENQKLLQCSCACRFAAALFMQQARKVCLCRFRTVYENRNSIMSAGTVQNNAYDVKVLKMYESVRNCVDTAGFDAYNEECSAPQCLKTSEENRNES